MNKPNIRVLRGSDFIDLEAWWNELGGAINLLADFDFLSKHNPAKLTKISEQRYFITLYEDRLDGKVYGTKEITLLPNDDAKITIQIGQEKEIWQITNTSDGFRKEKVNA